MSDLVELWDYFISKGVPARSLSFGRDKDDAYVLLVDNGKYVVYFSERGQRVDAHVHDDLESARKDLESGLKWIRGVKF
jgi:hypothetical protein